MNLSNIFVLIALILSCLCCCLSGCESLLDDAFKTQKQRDAEVRALRANPNILNEGAERKARAENMESIRTQEENEETDKVKSFNDKLEKQLRNNR